LKRAKLLWAVALLHPCLGAPAPLFAQDQAPEAIPGLKEFLQEKLRDPYDYEELRYSAATAVLHDDIKGVVVHLSGRSYCASAGCGALLLEPDGVTFRVITELSITGLPIRVLQSRTNGWRDITVLATGVGISAHRVVLKYDGHTYPDIPSMAPEAGPESEKGSRELPLAELGDTLLFDSMPSPKPGFNCAKASSNVEHLICNLPGLAKADQEMSVLYHQKMAANPNESAQIRRQQLGFLRQRDRCPDLACVVKLYQQRSLELSHAGGN
jgi:hypothetical protein